MWCQLIYLLQSIFKRGCFFVMEYKLRAGRFVRADSVSALLHPSVTDKHLLRCVLRSRFKANTMLNNLIGYPVKLNGTDAL